MRTKRIILGNEFIKALIDAKLLPEQAVSVLIEATVGDVVKIHYAVYGNEDWPAVVAAAASEAGVTHRRPNRLIAERDGEPPIEFKTA